MKNIVIRVATEADSKYAKLITDEMEASALARGTGISKRSPEDIIRKMKEGKAIIAVDDGIYWVGFAYIECWSNGEFVSNSGMIVSPAYRSLGIAKAIKQHIFNLSREKYPDAKIFSITTALTMMRLNTRLHFDTVTFNEIPKDPAFWKGCESCVNFPILKAKDYKLCLCTAMLYQPALHIASQALKIAS